MTPPADRVGFAARKQSDIAPAVRVRKDRHAGELLPPECLPAELERARAEPHRQPADPHSVDELASALPGHDVVLSALGVRPPQAFRPHTLVQECAASTVAAMTRAGVKRLVLVSAAVLFPEEGLRFAFFRWLLTHVMRDLDAAEQIVRATSLDWTIARPPRLIARSDERYRTTRDALPTGGFSMSFRAVAAFMLDAVEHRAHVARGLHRA